MRNKSNSRKVDTKNPCTAKGGKFVSKVEIKEPRNVELRHKDLKNRGLDDAINNALTNDPSFYDHSPELVNASSNVSFLTASGARLTMQFNIAPEQTTAHPATLRTSLAGIMTFEMIAGPGRVTSAAAAANIAATDLYGFVRHENSGGKNYDPNDLMLYVLAMDEAYMWFEYGLRAYGSAFLYSSTNYYVPDTLLQAEGFDAQDVRSNLAQFNYYLNVAAGKLNSLNVPNQFPYIERHRRLYRGIYMDAATGKSQLYLMKPRGYRLYDETSGPGSLIYNVIPKSAITVNDWWVIFDSIISAIRLSEDCGVISGDLLKAYGSGSMITVPAVPMSYTIMPTDDITLLRQFKNATVISQGISTFNTNTFNITQSATLNGRITYAPEFLNPTTGIIPTREAMHSLCFDQPLDLSLPSPSPMDVMEATRLKAQMRYEGSGGNGTHKYSLSVMGSEIVYACRMYYLGENGVAVTYTYDTYLSAETTSMTTAVTLMSRVFDYRPMQFWLDTTITENDNPIVEGIRLSSEFNNVAVVPQYTLDMIHSTALLSEFSVPIH